MSTLNIKIISITNSRAIIDLTKMILIKYITPLSYYLIKSVMK